MKVIYLTVIKILCLGFLVLTLLGWDRFGPPFITNGYEHTVRLETTYSDNVTRYSTLDPDVELVNRLERLSVTSIKVYSENGVLLADYPEDVLNELRAKSVDKHECWVVTEEGVFMIPDNHCGTYEWREYLESIQRQ